MAGHGLSDSDEMISDINVTPLVDIILVLLIIFMVTANVIERKALQVELPKAATGEDTKPAVLSLMLTKQGELYLNGQRSDENGLRAYAQSIQKSDANVQAVIAADAQVSHGSVVHLIDIVRQLGIYRFAIHIDPEEATPAQVQPSDR